MALRGAGRWLGGVLIVSGALAAALSTLLVISTLISSIDPDDGPVTFGNWVFATGPLWIGVAMIIVGVRLLPQSPYHAPLGGW